MSFVANAPLKFVDPTGHDPGCPGKDASECRKPPPPPPEWWKEAIRKFYKDNSVPGIAQKFIDYYVDEKGSIHLTPQEMIECNPLIDIRLSEGFQAARRGLIAKGGGLVQIDTTGGAGAGTNGTLGQFTAHYKGALAVDAKGNWNFNGTVDFIDTYDFDPHPNGEGRTPIAEIKVRITNPILPGKPFAITSDAIRAVQSSADPYMTFPDFPKYTGPQAVIDPITQKIAPLLPYLNPILRWMGR